jgi:hypothetical protein
LVIRYRLPVGIELVFFEYTIFFIVQGWAAGKLMGKTGKPSAKMTGFNAW